MNGSAILDHWQNFMSAPASFATCFLHPCKCAIQNYKTFLQGIEQHPDTVLNRDYVVFKPQVVTLYGKIITAIKKH